MTFQGETTWGYEEWSGPLFSISGADITVTGAPGHSLNGNGAKWWDGKGKSQHLGALFHLSHVLQVFCSVASLRTDYSWVTVSTPKSYAWRHH